MSVLSDEQLYNAIRPLCSSDELAKALVAVSSYEYHAVADAAIAADRAARVELWGLYDPVTGESFKVDGHSALSKEMVERCTPLYTAPPAAPVVPEDMSPANVPMYWRDESSNACAYAAGFNACLRAMLAAAPAPSQEPTT